MNLDVENAVIKSANKNRQAVYVYDKIKSNTILEGSYEKANWIISFKVRKSKAMTQKSKSMITIKVKHGLLRIKSFPYNRRQMI